MIGMSMESIVRHVRSVMLVITGGALCLTACGLHETDEKKSKNTPATLASEDLQANDTPFRTVATKDDLGVCSADAEKKFVYVRAEKFLYFCDAQSGAWQVLGSQGVPGPSGEAGAPGAPGVPGTPATQLTERWEKVRSENVGRIGIILATYEGSSSFCDRSSVGSGFVVGVDLVATNGHVVERVRDSGFCKSFLSKVEVWFPTGDLDDTRFESDVPFGAVTEIDRTIANSDDIALLRVSTGDRTPVTLRQANPVELSPKFGVSLLEEVLLIGYSGATSYPHSTLGRITAIHEITDDSILRGLIDSNRFVYEYDAHISKGGSGGPVFNAEGEVVSIEFAGFDTDGNNSPALGFGLEIKHLQNLLTQPRQWEVTKVPVVETPYF